LLIKGHQIFDFKSTALLFFFSHHCFAALLRSAALAGKGHAPLKKKGLHSIEGRAEVFDSRKGRLRSSSAGFLVCGA